jgi:hypothetical protein
MANEVDHPDIRCVVPPTRMDGTPSGDKPRTRHDPECSHFVTHNGEMLGDPVLATQQKMVTLPACKTCLERRGDGTGSRAKRDGAYGEPCASCQMALPLTVVCDDCG